MRPLCPPRQHWGARSARPVGRPPGAQPHCPVADARRRGRRPRAGVPAGGARGAHVEGSVATGFTSTYKVSLPGEGTVEQAAAVNPFDPTTIPVGGSVTVDGSNFVDTSFEASFRYIGTQTKISDAAGVSYTVERVDENTVRVLAGPTAVGKGTVATYIRDNHPEVWLSVSATTRAPRPGEVDGHHYHFVDDAEFDRLEREDQLLEWAVVHGRARYGTPRQPVEEALRSGRPALLEIDLQGARQVRRAMPDASFVFLAPPSWDELVQRLVGRGTEDEQERATRLATARTELAARQEFDHTIVNDDVARAAEELVSWMVDPPPRRTEALS